MVGRVPTMRKAVFAFFLFMLVPLVTSAYEVVLKDGTVVQGTLISETSETMILKKTSGVVVNFKKSEIDLEKTAAANKNNQSTLMPANKVEKPPQPLKTQSSHVFTNKDAESLRDKYDLGQGSFGESSPVDLSGVPEDVDENPSTEFDKEVLESTTPVLVEFWASWCGPCRLMAPILDEVAVDFEGKAKVYKVNVDEERGLARRYQITAIPAMLVFKDGEIAGRFTGVISKETIVQKLNMFIE